MKVKIVVSDTLEEEVINILESSCIDPLVIQISGTPKKYYLNEKSTLIDKSCTDVSVKDILKEHEEGNVLYLHPFLMLDDVVSAFDLNYPSILKSRLDFVKLVKNIDPSLESYLQEIVDKEIYNDYYLENRTDLIFNVNTPFKALLSTEKETICSQDILNFLTEHAVSTKDIEMYYAVSMKTSNINLDYLHYILSKELLNLKLKGFNVVLNIVFVDFDKNKSELYETIEYNDTLFCTIEQLMTRLNDYAIVNGRVFGA